MKRLVYIAAFLALMSCGGGSNDPAGVEAHLSVKTNPVSSAKGSQFVTVTASGSWTLSSSAAWATVSPTSGSGSTSNVVLSWSANSEAGSPDRTADLILNVGGKSTQLVITQLGVPEVIPPGGGGSTYPAGNVKGTPGWMEMPEIPASHDGYGVYTHDMTIGSTHIRNYSFYWDYQNLVAWWVAYPLNSWLVGTGSRTDQWGLDPLLAEKYQPVLYNGFKGGPYDRGHQLPSADRLHYSANVATFYFTNMTPQLSAFNQNIWANFENRVRSWGNGSDTLYVVTGCVPGKSTTKATDNEGKSVTVPEGYFKAVLRYKANSTFGFSDYAGCAVYLEHRSYSETTVNKEMSMSIADLEKKLGYQFFVNLPAKVGAETATKIKSQDPKTVAWWWQ